MGYSIQTPSLILPATWSLLTAVELVADALEHTSIEVPTLYLQEKIVHVYAQEVLSAGVPGNLWVWVELSPYESPDATAYWAAIGGGGGALAPVAPTVLVATGVNGTEHTAILPWTIHSEWARVVVQTPVPGPATAIWAVQVYISGKG